MKKRLKRSGIYGKKEVRHERNENGILVPWLNSFTNILGMSYNMLDEYFAKESQKFQELCEAFKARNARVIPYRTKYRYYLRLGISDAF